MEDTYLGEGLEKEQNPETISPKNEEEGTKNGANLK